MKTRSIVVGVVLGVSALSACGGSSTAGSSSSAGGSSSAATAGAAAVELVDVAAGQKLVADPGVTVIDVRTPEEFAAGHIARAQVVDFRAADFAERIGELDRNTPYFVYCHSGNRSGRATALMHELGFTTVYDLQGGITAWTAAGAPVTTD